MNEFPDVKPVGIEEYNIEWSDGEVIVKETSVFQLIKNIKDPEHSYTLEQLQVVSLDRIFVETMPYGQLIRIVIIPTIPHCSMVGLIGLSILYKLIHTISSKYTIRIEVKKESHTLSSEVTKQLADIERTYAAFLNENILSAIMPLL